MTDFLGRYRALLLDMNGTFMFGQDRFGPDQDYHAAYRALGGTRLGSEAARRAVTGCYDRMAALYEDPARVDRFPQVREVLAETATGVALSLSEAMLIEAVIAHHELGHVPVEYAAAVRRLAATHRLAVVTNLWSDKGPWLAELDRAGILGLFEAVVVSSDGGSIKPSPALFREALAALGVSPGTAVVVGDSLRCDVGGAAAAGLDSVWVNPGGAGRPPVPTFEVRSLLALAAVEPHARLGDG